MQFKWQRLGKDQGQPPGTWAVKVTGNMVEVQGLTGREVKVESRSGKIKTVTLGELTCLWPGASAAVYLVEGQEAPRPTRVDIDPGMYWHDGETYRVKLNRDRSRTYAERFNPQTGRYDYAKGAVYQLTPTEKTGELSG